MKVECIKKRTSVGMKGKDCGFEQINKKKQNKRSIERYNGR